MENQNSRHIKTETQTTEINGEQNLKDDVTSQKSDQSDSRRTFQKKQNRKVRPLDSTDNQGLVQYRVVIEGNANKTLEEMTVRINQGFDAGTVTKSDVANYLFSNLNRLLIDSDIKFIRNQHFDDKKMLNSILKTQDELPEELKKALRFHFGLTDRDKRKPQRIATEALASSDLD